jgi:ubiquinone biosynthesis protein COQ4
MATVTFNQVDHDKVLALPRRERWVRGLAALHDAAKDPERADRVLFAYEHLNAGTEHRRAERFYRDPDARKLYAENRTLDATTLSFDALEALPEDTLGHAYARFMRSRGITPDLFNCDGPLSPQAYLVKRMRQTHDLWHTVTGIDTDLAGELELQAFTLAQVWAPSIFIVTFFGALRALFVMPRVVPGILRGFFNGLRARRLVAVLWEDLWAEPLEHLRRKLNVGPRRPLALKA